MTDYEELRQRHLAELTTAYAGFMRPTLWDRAVSPELAGVPLRLAVVGAQHATHMTSALPQTFASPAVEIARFPVTQPLDRIVAGLNAYQPTALMATRRCWSCWPPRPAPAAWGSCPSG